MAHDLAMRIQTVGPSDAAWCAADPHFHEGDPALASFYEWLDTFEASEVPNLVLLGDLFEVWIALPRVQAPHQTRLLERLQALAESGRRIVFIVGNRDYFVESVRPNPFEVIAERWDLDLPGGNIRFEHGDLVNLSDHQYQRWRRFSRSRPVRAAFRLLPPPLQRSLAHRLERSLARTNLEYKQYHPEAELENWAEKTKREGCIAAVLGHFHRDLETRAAGITVRFLPQFRKGGPYLAVDEHGCFRLESFKAGE
ncbi:MAG: metallophosphoesterase [Acidobacteriota bacterium]|jgi:UDP-2,3-diacylglucosamine hydrolase